MSSILVVPIGGLGSRFYKSKYKGIKPLIDINGIPMIVASLRSFYGLADRILLAIRHDVLTSDIIPHLKEEAKNQNIEYYFFDHLTGGPAITIYDCLKHFNVPNDSELYTINCDQIVRWDPLNLKHYCSQDCDGVIVTFEGGDTKHSFVSVEKSGKPYLLTEKVKISDIALTGIHYWKSVGYYKNCVDRMVKDVRIAPNGEFYVSIAYNYMLEDKKKLLIYHIPREIFHPVGTPQELDAYLEK